MKPDLFFAVTNPFPPIGGYGRQLLAEGDSWFTLGTQYLPLASNILFELEFTANTAIVSCANPGDTLKHMVDGVNDPNFDRLLRQPNFASAWAAILISAGGNDLIDAAQVPPTKANGEPMPLEDRLLLTVAEAASSGSASEPGDYISEAGFAQLAGYLGANFRILVQRREQGPSAGRPIFVHTYATPTARPAGALWARDGWIFPALVAYGVPPALRQPVTKSLFGRLRQLLLELDTDSGRPGALPAFHVFDSAALDTLVPADAGESGPSGDWVNEIHLSKRGYRKMGRAFGPWIETVLARYPGSRV